MVSQQKNRAEFQAGITQTEIMKTTVTPETRVIPPPYLHPKEVTQLGVYITTRKYGG